MVASLVLAWCRLVVGGVFVLSLSGKLRNVPAFRQAIRTFKLLPDGMEGTAAWLVLIGEFLVVIGILLGGRWLFPTFLLATVLLILFSGAMASVLVRQIRTACQCFGTSDIPVAMSDLWRNGGLLCCTFSGGALILWSPAAYTPLTLMTWFLAGVTATAFVAFWLRIGELMALFQTP